MKEESMKEESATGIGTAIIGMASMLLIFSVWWISMVVNAVNADVRHRSKDREIDSTISSLVSATIVGAEREGRETILRLADGRVIVVRGYKGHHFYERSQ